MGSKEGRSQPKKTASLKYRTLASNVKPLSRRSIHTPTSNNKSKGAYRRKNKNKEILYTYEVAAACRVSPDTIRRWIKRGDLPKRGVPHGRLLITRKELNEFSKKYNVYVDWDLLNSKNYHK